VYHLYNPFDTLFRVEKNCGCWSISFPAVICSDRRLSIYKIDRWTRQWWTINSESLGCTFDNDKPVRGRLESLCTCQKPDHCVERETRESCSFVANDRADLLLSVQIFVAAKGWPAASPPPILHRCILLRFSLWKCRRVPDFLARDGKSEA